MKYLIIIASLLIFIAGCVAVTVEDLYSIGLTLMFIGAAVFMAACIPDSDYFD